MVKVSFDKNLEKENEEVLMMMMMWHQIKIHLALISPTLKKNICERNHYKFIEHMCVKLKAAEGKRNTMWWF